MSDPSRPPTLSLALQSVLGAAVDGGARSGLLAVVRPVDGEHAPVVAFPAPRRPLDDREPDDDRPDGGAVVGTPDDDPSAA